MKPNPTVDANEVDPNEPVQLIASGYEWNCPGCEHYNREIEIMDMVQCEGCNCVYFVDEAFHAHA